VIELKSESMLPHFPALQCERLSQIEPLRFAEAQPRAASAINRLISMRRGCQTLLLSGFPGVDYEQTVMDLIDDCSPDNTQLFDLCYAENLQNPYRPLWLKLKPGSGIEFCELIGELLRLLSLHLDAEAVVTRILRKQDQDEKIANYLGDLAAHVTQGGTFTHPVLINLLIHHETETPPVIYGRDLSWASLFGAINYQTEQGTIYSHHHLLESGLLREANGGYLILPLEELMDQPELWFKLRNALETGFLDWSSQTDVAPATPFFIPEPSPLNVKLILVGDRLTSAEFNLLDREISERIFLRTDLISELPLEEGYELFLGLLSGIQQSNELLDFDAPAIEALSSFACRLCEHQQILSIAETQIGALMRLADSVAREEQSSLVTLSHVQAALAEQEYRLNYIVEQSDQGVVDGQILLQTEGEVIGQINGLSVIEIMGHPYDFGEPVRLTATVHLGDGDVVDIERKAELAGHIHAKAMMIIHGYISTQFGAENPSPLSANLVFEQSYNEIDGDSASLTGLCALLSALAQQPIFQHLAVTGAVDQFGNVQPVGGLNEKIEGFFRVCRIHGMNGRQGVIIPATNQLQLVLSNEVIEAVEKGEFHIYPVSHVDEAIQLLTGCEAGDIDDEETLYGRIRTRLDELNGSQRHRGVLYALFRRFAQVIGVV
jgi:Lon-like ATP-dependent protease